MPQHPVYANSPIWDIRNMFELLRNLERYGFIHEDMYDNVDLVMNELYREKRAIKWIDADEDLLSATQLFEELSVELRRQYVQDLRNVVGHFLSADSWRLEGLAEEIISLRDISYSNMHVVNEQDTEFLEKFQTERRSVWFHSDTNPEIEGIYEVSNSRDSPSHNGFAFWDGRHWYRSCVMFNDVINQPRNKPSRWEFGYCWRGLKERHYLY